ncbi:hypothetical protein ABLE93_22695 [Xanthobacter sp. KR7-65]|jgi:hypothetical protein|uniref:hypothetical protein n=1 Tax=Xanthobacter sp. KR7-65 TaxID=3156612 RepID=UPI0032B3FF00
MTAPGMVARRLAYLEAACRETRGQLVRIERLIQCRAERITVTAKLRARRSRRRGPRGAPADERLLREHVDRLIFERRDEIAALAQKPARQEHGIAAPGDRKQPVVSQFEHRVLLTCTAIAWTKG